MLEFLKNMANRTLTENGAVTQRSTGSDCLNLFATVGALRAQNEAEIAKRFLRAFAENRDLAMKILFYARDVRGGLGERRVFRVLLRYLAANEPASLRRNLPYIAEYGRWDDVLVLLDSPLRAEAIALLREQFEADMAALQKNEPVSLHLSRKDFSSVSHRGDMMCTVMARSKSGRQKAKRRSISRTKSSCKADAVTKSRQHGSTFQTSAQGSDMLGSGKAKERTLEKQQTNRRKEKWLVKL